MSAWKQTSANEAVVVVVPGRAAYSFAWHGKTVVQTDDVPSGEGSSEGFEGQLLGVALKP